MGVCFVLRFLLKLFLTYLEKRIFKDFTFGCHGNLGSQWKKTSYGTSVLSLITFSSVISGKYVSVNGLTMDDARTTHDDGTTDTALSLKLTLAFLSLLCHRRRRSRRRYVVKHFSLGYTIKSIYANLMNLHSRVHPQKGHNLTKRNNSARLFTKLCFLYILRK